MKKILLSLFLIATVLLAHGQCWDKVATGNGHSLAVKTDGSLWAWGNNSSGQFGNGSVVSSSVPALVSSESNWQQLAVANTYSCAIKNDGTLWTWGGNGGGGLGDGLGTDTNVPAQIGTGHWKYISCGPNSTMGIMEDGTLWKWGFFMTNGNGAAIVTTPTQIGTVTDWKEVSVSLYHSVLLKEDGSLWTMGLNSSGVLGTGSSNWSLYTNEPVPVFIGATFQKISAGFDTSAAIDLAGTLWIWGGIPTEVGTEVLETLPIAVAGAWKEIGALYNGLAGIQTDGTLWTWGENNNGQLGNGTGVFSGTPTQVGNSTGYEHVYASGNTCSALKAQNVLVIWGFNDLVGEEPDYNIFVPTLVQCSTATIPQHALQAVSIYPNPVKDILYLNNPAGITIDKIIVTDVMGKTILTQSSTSAINVQQLPAGMYFITVTAGRNTYQDKFIKQ